MDADPGPPHHEEPTGYPYIMDPTQPFPPPDMHMANFSADSGEHMHDSIHDQDLSDGEDQGHGGLEHPPKRKRRRQALSCSECKRRKIKCDRLNPCTQCIKRGDGESCQWHVIQPQDKFVSRYEYEELKQKLDALEHSVAQFGGRPPFGIHHGHPLAAAWGMPMIADPGGAGDIITGPSGTHSSTTSDSKKRVAQTLSGLGKDERLRHPMLPMAMHPMQIPPYSFPIPIPMAGLMPGSPMMHPMFNGMPMMQPPPMRALPFLPNINPENWSQLGIAGNPGMELGFAALPLVSGRGASSGMGGAPAFPPPMSLPAGYWLQGLPSKQICDAVVKYYFECVSWSHAVVVRSSLESRIKIFWSTLNGEASSAWVALYFMVLYHGISNMDPEDSINAPVAPNQHEWRRLCQSFWHGAQFALAQTDLAATHEVEVIQALILLASVHLSLDRKGWQAFAPTLSFTIRIAQNMGLSILGKETKDATSKPGLMERELKRRLWWTLVVFDWQYASHLQYVYCINPGQFNTDFPANVDLEDLDKTNDFREKEIGIPTSASLLRAKGVIADVARKLCDARGTTGEMPYEALLECDRQLANALHSLPLFLTSKDEKLEREMPSVTWLRTAFMIGVHSSIIALHRSHFISNFAEPKYAHTVSTSVASADRVLYSMKEVDASGFPGRRWWGILLHCYKAAVVLALDHKHKLEMDSNANLSEDREGLILLVLGLLTQATEVISLAKKAATVLQLLLDEAHLKQPLIVYPTSEKVKSVKRSRATDVPDHKQSKQPTLSDSNGTSGAASPNFWDKIFELELEVQITEEPPPQLQQRSTKSNNHPFKPASVERAS